MNLVDFQPIKWKGVVCHQTPLDMWNYHDLVQEIMPAVIVEVGRGEGGTANFLREFGGSVVSVDVDDPVPDVRHALVILDGDVYAKEAMLQDLETYEPMASRLVVCHADRADWGSLPALEEWLPQHPKWRRYAPRFPTQHAWLTQ